MIKNNYSIYCDGACFNNGQPDAKGGWGFIITDESNEILTRASGKLREGTQTNNRAELEALFQALLFVYMTKEKDSFYAIYSDSEMVVKGVIGESNRNTNLDIWKGVEHILTDKSMKGIISIEHVKAHQKKNNHSAINNDIADKLAKKGARNLLEQEPTTTAITIG